MQNDVRSLKRRLVAADGAALAAAWSAVLLGGFGAPNRSLGASILLTILTITTGLFVIWRSGLFLSRRCSVRATEMRLIGRAVLLLAVALLLADRLGLRDLGAGIEVSEVVWGTALAAVLLTFERSLWRAVLRAARHDGRRVRPVMVLGANADAARLTHLFGDHPEHGFRVMGVVGDWDDAVRHGLQKEWLGSIADIDRLVAVHRPTGVVIASGAIDLEKSSELIARLQRDGVHVHWSSGVSGVSAARLRSLPMAREPIFYLEEHKLGRSEQVTKRALDLTGALVGLVLLAPVFAVISLVVKLGDRGPVFYRQLRVGRHGTTFQVIKFRTMRQGADRALAELAAKNERNGPLFKLEDDPRVTSTGGSSGSPASTSSRS